MLTKKRVASLVACSFSLVLASCSDDAPPPQANKEPYHPVFNPSPEQIAQRQAEEKARLPLTNQLPVVARADRAAYVDMMTPLIPMQFYIANRSWDESPERVADDIGRFGMQVNNQRVIKQGVPAELFELTDSYSKSTNAFDKADLAKKITAYVEQQAGALGGKRLVKVALNARLAPINPYDLGSRTFVVDTALFTDKTEYTHEEKEKSRRTMRIEGKLKAHLFSIPNSYHYGFTGASALENIKVEDEVIARRIEAARTEASIVIYGYIARIQRAHDKGVPVDKPYTFVQPHFADIVSESGEILYTAEL